MPRATWVLAATTIAGIATSLWLYFDNRDLRSQLDGHAEAPAQTADAPKVAAARTADPWAAPSRTQNSSPAHANTPQPSLPDQPDESRLDKRKRRQMEFAAMLGRSNGETEDEWRARMVPLIKAGLAIPRQRVEEMRKQAEEKAHVSPEQSAKLDKAFDKIYGDALDYTNKAIADGQLSPYERNVSGWLEFAGGLGGILNDANGQIGQILSADQMHAMSDAGFEWGEYLGAEAPWEKLTPPPPPKPH